jgi:hypothetical protein
MAFYEAGGAGRPQSGIEQLFEHAWATFRDSLGTPRWRDADATHPSRARRRRTQLVRAGLFGTGVCVGILFVYATDLDRAFIQAYAPQALAAERRVAHHARKAPPHRTSSLAIPTLDVDDLPSADE